MIVQTCSTKGVSCWRFLAQTPRWSAIKGQVIESANRWLTERRSSCVLGSAWKMIGIKRLSIKRVLSVLVNENQLLFFLWQPRHCKYFQSIKIYSVCFKIHVSTELWLRICHNSQTMKYNNESIFVFRATLEKKRKTEDAIAMLEGSGKKKKMKKKHKSWCI